MNDDSLSRPVRSDAGWLKSMICSAASVVVCTVAFFWLIEGGTLMNKRSLFLLANSFVGPVAFLFAMSTQANDGIPFVAPAFFEPRRPDLRPLGRSVVAMGVRDPAAENPVFDTSGQYCALRQVGDVWFLAGAFGGPPVVRNCEVPAGKSLFFPLINNSYFAFLNDPLATRTEQYVRDQARCTEPAQISLRINGFNIPKALLTFTGASGRSVAHFQRAVASRQCVWGGPKRHTRFGTKSKCGAVLRLRVPASSGSSHRQVDRIGMHPNNPSQDITYHLSVDQ